MSPAAASYFRDGAPWILKSKVLRKGKNTSGESKSYEITKPHWARISAKY